MKFLRGLNQIKSTMPNCAVTIGNFDGIHLGHQKLIERLIEKARALNLPSVLITFEPLSKEYFHAGEFPRLMSLREKYQTLSKKNLDYLLCIRFNKKLAQLPAEAFVQEILLQKLHMKALIVGEDFRFGAQRKGEAELLKKLAQNHLFDLELMPLKNLHEQVVSSSRIREAIKNDDFILAEQLLGRPFSVCGKVIYGDQRGRELGFPTANIALRKKLSFLRGIYIVRVRGIRKYPIPGVASVGLRPMFEVKKPLLEVYLLNFNETLYGKELEVEFIKKLRDEETFETIENLVSQIKNDVAQGIQYFEKQGIL